MGRSNQRYEPSGRQSYPSRMSAKSATPESTAPSVPADTVVVAAAAGIQAARGTSALVVVEDGKSPAGVVHAGADGVGETTPGCRGTRDAEAAPGTFALVLVIAGVTPACDVEAAVLALGGTSPGGVVHFAAVDVGGSTAAAGSGATLVR